MLRQRLEQDSRSQHQRGLMEVPHTHIHLIPLQKESDMLFSNPKLSFTPEEFAEIAANIQAAL